MTFRIFLRSAVTAIGLGGDHAARTLRLSALVIAHRSPGNSARIGSVQISEDVSPLEAVALWLAPFLAPYLVFDGVAKASEMAISRPSIL